MLDRFPMKTLMLLYVLALASCSSHYSSAAGGDHDELTQVAPAVNNAYAFEKFDVNLTIGRLCKRGEYYSTDSVWKVVSQQGAVLCKAPSRIYSGGNLTVGPPSGFVHKVWVHDRGDSSIIAIEEFGSWYNRSSHTVIFERKNGKWKSSVIFVPGPYFIAEGNSGSIDSMDQHGYVKFADPTADVHKKGRSRLISKHYSTLAVKEVFPEGNNW